MTDREVIILMQTVHMHMMMENCLEKEGISFKTRVKPRQLGTDCGMALGIAFEDIDRIVHIAKKKNAVVHGVYLRNNDTWQVFEPGM